LAVGAAVLAWCGGSALAEKDFTYTFQADRDNSNNTNEQHNNTGGSDHGYCGDVGTGYQFYVDWDTAAMKAQTDPVGYPIDYELWIHFEGNGGWGHWGLDWSWNRIATVWSENDWVEGNGASYDYDTDYNWTTAKAATHLYAQDVKPGQTGTVTWDFPGNPAKGHAANPGCTFVDTYYSGGTVVSIANSAKYHMGQGHVRYGDHGCSLDQAVMDDMYDNENNRGLVVYNTQYSVTDHGHMYTRAISAHCPWIEATFTAHDADANLDAEVDVLDLTAFANNFGQADPEWGDADFNGDGEVDVLDLTILANNFGWAAGGGGGAAVPEPVGLALVLAGAGALLRRRRARGLCQRNSRDILETA